MSELFKTGRIAFREEGKLWNAYYALPNSMVGAIYLASINIALVARPERKDQFMILMRDVVGDILEAETGHRPTYTVQEAPDSEKGGHG